MLIDFGCGLANATIQQRLVSVRLFFDFLVEEGVRVFSSRPTGTTPSRIERIEMTATATDQPLGALEIVHPFHGPMPTGVSVSRTGRIFVNFPRWGDEVEFTVAEIRDGELVAYPSQAFNNYSGAADPDALVSVQSIVVGPADRLWILDTGSPMFEPTSPGGPKLVRVDLDRGEVAQTIVFPGDVALSTSYLNDVRFDLRRGRAGAAFITDSSDQGRNGLIVVDLATGQSWRRLDDHPSTKGETPPGLRIIVEGQQLLHRNQDGCTSPLKIGSDGIAISADGERLYYCALSSRRWWSVSSTHCSIATSTTTPSPQRLSTRGTKARLVTGWKPMLSGGSTSPTVSTTRSIGA